jgi:MFS family permease
VTFVVLALGIAAFALLQSLVIPVLTTVQHQLHTTQNTVTWVLTAYLLSASIMTPILGRVGDMTGKKRIFVATLAALAVGSLLAAIAPSIGVLIVARVIQGFAGGMLPVAFGIIRDEFPAEKVAGAVGAIAALTAVGAGLGIVLAGPIVDALDYHWLFWLPLILTVAAAVSAILFVPESPVRTPGRVSWLPALLLSGWLVALLLALSQAPTWGWSSGRTLGLLTAAVVVAAGWLVAELRAATPLIDMKMMRRTAVWTNNLVALLIGLGMYATFAFLPEFVQTPSVAGYGFGASITRSGLMLLPSAVTMFLVGIFAGRLSRKLGGKTLVIAGCLIGCVAMSILAFAHQYQWQIYLSNALMGIGFGLAFSAMSALIVAAVPASQTALPAA